MSYQDIAHHYEDGPEDPTPPAFERRSEHQARKAHGCSLCGGTIWPGQRYSKLVFLGDDGLEIYKTHLDHAECEAGRQETEARQREADELQGQMLRELDEELARETAALNGEPYSAAPRPLPLTPTAPPDDADLPF